MLRSLDSTPFYKTSTTQIPWEGAAQLEENNRYGTLRRLWVEYRDHWGVHDAPELPEFPTKFTLQMKF